MDKYFETQFCFECMRPHMVEVTRKRDLICHGENYFWDAQKEGTHYSKRHGKGFELILITSPKRLPIEWEIERDNKLAEALEPYIQDW